MKIFTIATTTGLGLITGLMLGSTNKNLAHTIGFGLGGALLGGGTVALFYDTKFNKMRNGLESDLDRYIAENKRLNTIIKDSEKVKHDLQKAQDTALKTISEMSSELSDIKVILQTEINQGKELSQENKRLLIRINELQGEVTELNKLCQEKDATLIDYEKQFDDQLAQEFEKKKQELVKQELANEFELTQQAFDALDEMRALMEEFFDSHQSQRQYFLGIHDRYLAHKENLKNSHQKAYDELKDVKDSLELRVRILQQELAGDLTEPQYADFGFDINGRIANELARTIWQDLQLPLAVKGFQVKPDGAVDIGYGYSRSVSPQTIVETISKHSEALAKKLRLFKITSVRKLEITDCIVVSFRQSPAVKDDEIKLMVGSPDQFISYITSHPIRYRLIADPGIGKTPTTAVMISEILKAGCTRGNTGKGEKVPNTLVTVSYPGAVGSLKDSSYPLDIFLKYGDTTAAIKSFEDCLEDGKYRVQNPSFAANYFQVWVWDELDNTLNSCSEPYKAGENLKKILKQFGHNNIGWIVSGQSVMTKQIPGFTNDDRSLFTEIIIGIPKIRHYLNTYGKGKNSESNLAKLSRNLDAIEEYIEHKNELVTDDARLLRVALIVDSRSPKLYFLPNLDSVAFNYQEIEEVKRLASRVRYSGTSDNLLTRDSSNLATASTDTVMSSASFLTIGGTSQGDTKPHCPHCGNANLTVRKDKRYYCLGCKKVTVANKIVWR
ncbi:hypothetical protein H6G33_37510 [Calothrix sp. FACHB-1219]|uniref:hypothetical protein n=1 Tax=unclassified Calothrix TaxID=2619626 RepID=UPI0016835AEA|nr:MULTISPECIES: hypothetical protein [unclassified Calothrix]MBD2208089.1 hypothetical protein [Calothrix sp. FACHB-168]MBD2222627.1 hypothetical protein [Calothrix sp. FACHB-1219]